MAALVLRLSAGGPRPTNTGGMGAMGTSTASAEDTGSCAKSAVAQTDRACKSLQEAGHGQVPGVLSKGDGQARDGRVPHV